MTIAHSFIQGFEEGRAVGARLQELFAEGDMTDPAVVAEIEQLSGLMRPITTVALKIIHERLASAGARPRKALETMGLTHEEARKLADAFLAIYEDEPEARA